MEKKKLVCSKCGMEIGYVEAEVINPANYSTMGSKCGEPLGLVDWQDIPEKQCVNIPDETNE
jgi:hypothetical protein